MDEAIRHRIGFVSSFMLAAAKEKTTPVFPLAARVPVNQFGFVPSNSRQGFSPEIPPCIGPSAFVTSTLHWGCTPFSCDSVSARLVGLDYFGARYFSSAQGRWTSPDPMMASAKASNPQTWNRYAYTLNDPLRYVDPDGLQEISVAECQKTEGCVVIPINIIYDRNGTYNQRTHEYAHSDDVDQSFRFDADQIGAKRRRALSV